MSLINDALKKAQAERPSAQTHHPGMENVPHQAPQKPRRRKRYLFGFIMAVLVVGLFSTAVSSYLVYQILGSDESTPAAASQEVAAPVSVPTTETEQPVAAQVTEPSTTEVIQETEPTVSVPVEESVAAADPTPVPLAPVAAVESPSREPVEAEPVAEPIPVVAAEMPEVAPSASPGDFPEVWTRLQDFEIRGVMSGGSGRLPKVLIYDLRSQKSRSFKPGDLIDGALSLKVASVTPGTIYFENHAGARFSKAF